jgi:hypothetical protein
MPSTVVYLSINGIEQNLEVDLESACFAEVAEAFGYRSLKRIGTNNCFMSPRLKLKAVLPKENSAFHRFTLQGDVQGAFLFVRSASSTKLCRTGSCCRLVLETRSQKEHSCQ